MKTLILIAIQFGSFLYGYTQIKKYNSIVQNDTAFYSSVLDDFSTHSNFISILVKSEDSVLQYVVENAVLYRYLYQKTKFSEVDYKRLVFKKMTENLPLIIGTNLPPSFRLVSIDSTILKNSTKSKQEFIDIYFKDSFCMKKEVNELQESAVIFQLFKWGIATKTDCETGFTILTKR